MEFNILIFVFLSLIVAFLNQFFPIKSRKFFLLFINLLFYFMLDLRYSFLLILSVLLSYYLAQIISQQKKAYGRKTAVSIGIVIVCITLFFFKYCNSFLVNKTGTIQILMPLGISYYSFKIISYLVDVYRRPESTATSLVSYSIYISFFPQIICGPITRSDEICSFIDQVYKLDIQKTSRALYRIISGLFKKVVIADRLILYVTTVFENWEEYPALALWMAAFFYSIQLYCDFAGYSEIIIGITELFGFRCGDNFQMPYFSYSIKEFWKRWHISLSTWLRDYIYFPLGGSHVSNLRQKINVLVVFIISGIWHGNKLNFVVWGLWHGILNILSPQKSDKAWVRLFQTLCTFCCVMFGWILFNTDSMMSALAYLGKMFTELSLDLNAIIASVMPFSGDYACLSYLLTVSVFILILFIMEWRDYSKRVYNSKVRVIIFLFALLFWGTIGNNTFLYANF